MLVEEKIKIKIIKRNIKWYQSKGYNCTLNDNIEVWSYDLSNGCGKEIKVECDYCNKIIKKIYNDYFKQRKIIQKDTCNDCKHLKIKELNLIKYGVENPLQVKEIHAKVIEKLRYNYIYIKERFEERGYILLSNTYINGKQKLDYICPKHADKGIQQITYGKLQQGQGCQYCGRERADKIRSVQFKTRISGEKNPNWKGGITPENHKIRSSNEYKEWRKSVFKRDDYTCQCCGDVGGVLRVHHLENFADNPDLRLDINNGITLCEKCHDFKFKGSFHDIYGNKNNNLKQFEEYKTRLGSSEFNCFLEENKLSLII